MESNSNTRGTDDWLARDKIYHIIFCFTINVVVSLVAAHSRYSFLRRRSISIGSLLSLAAGAAKEVADELGFFRSAGASSRDAVADLVGVFLAVLVLSFTNRPRKSSHIEGMEIV